MTAFTPADTVLRGGPVLLLDAADTVSTAIAVRQGRIVALGEAAVALIADTTRVVELDGRTVMPGINDSHLHASWLGALWPATVFGGEMSAPHELVRDDAERRTALLRAGELLASLGITSYTEPGIGPGEDEGPTGCFGTPVLDLYRQLDAEGLLKARVNLLMLYGLVDGSSDAERVLGGIHSLGSAAAITPADADPSTASSPAAASSIRVATLNASAASATPTAPAVTPRPERFRIAGVKVFADGIPPMRAAFIHGEYLGGGHGELLLSGGDEIERENNLRRVVLAAHRAGLQIAVHATGDRSIDAVVAAVRQGQAEQARDLRHYIVHGDLMSSTTLAAAAEAGMGLTLQTRIAEATAEWMAAVLPPDRVAAAWPLEAAYAAGVQVSLSSDSPVLSPDWREEIAAARRLLQRSGGDANSASERTITHRLLRAYTAIPAWFDHAENWKGTLEMGRVADLVVLDANPYEVGAEGLPAVGIEQTYLDGELVYDAVGTVGTVGAADRKSGPPQ